MNKIYTKRVQSAICYLIQNEMTMTIKRERECVPPKIINKLRVSHCWDDKKYNVYKQNVDNRVIKMRWINLRKYT